MTKVYIAKGSGTPENYHEDPDCNNLQNIESVSKSDLPDTVSPCSFCAGGMKADDLREIEL